MDGLEAVHLMQAAGMNQVFPVSSQQNRRDNIAKSETTHALKLLISANKEVLESMPKGLIQQIGESHSFSGRKL